MYQPLTVYRQDMKSTINVWISYLFPRLNQYFTKLSGGNELNTPQNQEKVTLKLHLAGSKLYCAVLAHTVVTYNCNGELTTIMANSSSKVKFVVSSDLTL